jgi:hypothetical protein
MLSGDDLTIFLFFVGTAISIAGTAISAAGWRHPVLIGGLFSLSGICLIIGAAWPALKTVSPTVTAIVDQVATNPVAWFAVLILGMASVLLPKRGGRPFHIKEREAAAESPAASSPATTPATAPKKTFIDVSPAYLMDLYKNRTSVQGDALASAYVGKWIVVTGKVRDIYETGGTFTAQIYDKDEKFISASFSKEASERISHVAHGTTITISGEVAYIDLTRTKLQSCDLDKIGAN